MKHIVDVTGTPVTANYVWDVNRSVPEILQDSTNTYVYGLGLISSTDGSGNQTYYTGDGLGSTTDLTNGANPPVRTDGYSYDAFGAPTHSPGTSSQPFQFTGQQTDGGAGDTQMQYLRARYYDPSTGRFLGKDPLSGSRGIPSTQNPYVYALDNPATLSDPLGLCALSCEGSIASVSGPTHSQDDFFSVLHDYLSCVDFGVGLALFVLQFTPIGFEATVVGVVLSSSVAALANKSDPNSVVSAELQNGAMTLSGPTFAFYVKRTLQTYGLYGNESGGIRPSAKFAVDLTGLTVGGLLTAYTGIECAKRTGLFDAIPH